LFFGQLQFGPIDLHWHQQTAAVEWAIDSARDGAQRDLDRSHW